MTSAETQAAMDQIIDMAFEEANDEIRIRESLWNHLLRFASGLPVEEHRSFPMFFDMILERADERLSQRQAN